ncbi:hypothetical protein ASG36_06540 [Geodermatophilus sp. Leaf369]|uniref:hypothetical protein n=1 Tax=Geodermatophilus sp. Leaf369 TaxID=1736354 RepID=UPI0006FF0FB8|nr:hypothetical protein [Geodermatophilus sp. Leaf369]KQS60558.1 hypothetical protein ASG36_06540 [Geodermatophilus sp. Leaf369]
MESDEVHRDRAAADLAALQADRTAMADRLRQPGWYDPALGVLVAGFFATYSFGYPWVTLAALPVFLGGIALLMAGYRRHTGTWVNGFHGGPATTKVVRAWLVACVVVLGAGLLAELAFDVRFAMVVAGVVLGVGAALLSRRWTTVYQRELRGEL